MGTTYILVFCYLLYYRERHDNSLSNPYQVCAYGIPFWDNPYNDTQPLSIQVDNDSHIPLQAMGTKLLFIMRVLTQHELLSCLYVNTISSSPWNPSNIAMIEAIHQGRCAYPWKRQVSAVDSTAMSTYKYILTLQFG
jgi:hypothetical protein